MKSDMEVFLCIYGAALADSNVLCLQTELISGDQNGNIRVWDLTANSCSCELVCSHVLLLACFLDTSHLIKIS